ncbi:MAG: NTP transferase domain-containing protein, partial [Aestuariivirgaceae bacterium]|nr:NTP transferase domain-containing protein [Aestuariivirgaceae bacterium]
MTSTTIIVLAAGKGTRMRSAASKVLHRAAGRSLLGHVLNAAAALKPARAIVVNGPGQADVADEALRHLPSAAIVTQQERLGTGHAVSMALPGLKKFSGTVMVLYGDTPLLSAETLKALAAQVNAKTPFAVLGFEAEDPTGYGRLLRNKAGDLTGIREELDASKKEKAIKLCNSGVIALDAGLLAQLLPLVGNKNAKGEYYLTDLVALAVK